MKGPTKTIFLAVFEGVEAKNILRTPILPTLLADPLVRIILFTKSEERAAYYREEFPDRRLRFEVVARPPVTGLDRLFGVLKFTLLRTATTDLKRRMARQEGGGLFRYAAGMLLNRLLARPFIRRLVRFLDFAIVRDHTYDEYFRRYRPALVFLPHLFDEPETHLLRAAKRFHVPSVGFVNSWDKATSRCILRLLPDKVVVFNNIVKRDMIKHNEMKPENIFVGGLPQYDLYLRHKPVKREEFFSRYGLDPRKHLVVYAPMGRAFSDADLIVLDILRRLISGGAIKNAELLVRFQPNDFVDEVELKKRPGLAFDCPGRRFSAKRGVDWDMDENDLRHLADTLYHSSLIVSYASSICVDALAYDKPCLNINFEPPRPGMMRRSPTNYYQTDHYKNVLETGAVLLADSEEELVVKANELLSPLARSAAGLLTAEVEAGRERLKREQWQFLDGRSGERIGRFLLDEIARRG